jgi:hypothetical protein
MTNIEVQFNPLTLFGYTLQRVPQDILDKLNKDVDKIKNNFNQAKPYNKNLAGNITNEYALDGDTSYIDPLIETVSKAFWDVHKRPDMVSKPHYIQFHEELLIRDLWVNFQKKTEYNPIHNHSGVLSFVIWLKIPYDIEEEKNLPQYKNSKTPYGGFNFIYPDFSVKGGLKTVPIPVSNQYEGVMVVFPSWLGHYVDPFYTSDEYRISIAGNIGIQV